MKGRSSASLWIALAVTIVAADLVFVFDRLISTVAAAMELLLLVLWLRRTFQPVREGKASRRANIFMWALSALTVLAFAQKVWHLSRFWRGVAAPNEADFYGNFTALALFFAVTLGLLRGERLRRLLEAVEKSPARLSALTFALFIFFGGVALSHPASLRGENGARLLDGVFTATSAVCLTGLCPFNVPATYSGFGQAVLLLLMQAGGLGYVILASALTIVIGRRLDAHRATALAETIDTRSVGELKSMVRFVIVVTLAVELAGAALLYLSSLPTPEVALGPESDHPAAGAGSRVWWAVFLSVSAFCNCGFALSNGNLMAFGDSFAVSAVVALLIIAGGLGFPVLSEVFTRLRSRRGGQRPKRASLHTRVMLATTLVLIVVPAVALLVLEWNRSLSALSWPGRVLAAFFQSVSMRTGGFNSVDVVKFGAASMWLTSIVMLIGGGPVSTAGGIKATAASLSFAFLRGEVHGEKPRLFDRLIPEANVRRAIAVVFVSVIFVLFMTGALLIEGRHDSLRALFEVASAFATCGLSSGVTAELSDYGKVVLILTMWIGRVGPMTFVVALFARDRSARIAPAEERVLLG